MREPYNTASINNLAATPGSLKRILKKGDMIYTSQEDRAHVEKLLRTADVRFSSSIDTYDISIITIS